MRDTDPSGPVEFGGGVAIVVCILITIAVAGFVLHYFKVI